MCPRRWCGGDTPRDCGTSLACIGRWCRTGACTTQAARYRDSSQPAQEIARTPKIQACGTASCDNVLSRVAKVSSIRELFENGTTIDHALWCAALAAHRSYARAGLSMPVWSQGRIRWLSAEDLEVDGSSGAGPGSELPSSRV